MLQERTYTPANPYLASLIRRRRLNKEGSAKDTRHLEIDLGGSGLEYQPGDALGVRALNCPDLVGAIITALSADGDEEVADAEGRRGGLRELLMDHEVNRITDRLLKAVAERLGSDEISALLAPEKADYRKQWAHGKDVLDILYRYPELEFTPSDLMANLKPLKPRLYSIASALEAYPHEAHLCVGVVTFEAHGRRHKGVCSTWLGQRLSSRDPLPCFVHHAKRFKPPQDGAVPILMVGPGTGIAPFRSFLQHRRLRGHGGRNWLIFGDQHAATDFLYGDEFTAMHREGFLTRLDLAWSRDQERKIYVQHRLWEQAAEVWRWLAEGAHLYVCGDALRMAKDVDAILHRIVRDHGGRDADGAKAYVEELKEAGRYQRDVYAVV